MGGFDAATLHDGFRPSGLAAVPNDPSLRARLQLMVDLLDSLERQVADARLTLRQLSVQLDAAPGQLGPAATPVDDPWSDAPIPLFASEPPPEPSGPTLLRLRCLGRFEVTLGDQLLPQRRAGKGQAILKFLAARPRQPVPRDVLLEALWPDVEPGVANNRLKVAIHHLRQVCVPLNGRPGQGESVVYRDGFYSFNPRIPLWSDVEEFQAAWRQGQRHEREGRVAEAMDDYIRAEQLYRGDFLEEDILEDWTLVRREELKDTYLTILGKLSRHWLTVDHLDRAVEAGKKLLVADPCREDMYRHLMVCFTRAGQRGLALHWFELGSRMLWNQLQLAPEAETVALYQAIRDGQSVSGADRA